MSQATAQIKVKADPTQLPSGLRAALKMVQGFAHQAFGILDPRKHKDPDHQSVAFGSFMGNVASNLAMRGLDMVVDQGKKILDFNEELIRLGIDLDKTPAQMEAVGAGIRRISDEVGIGADKVLAGGRAYADLAGEESFTMEKMALIARSAQASGADVKDMAELMFTLTENMKVPPNELEDTIGGIIQQAKKGSIHFRELAHELVALGAVYQQFGITGRAGANQLGAMMQIAMHGFGSPSEAATGIMRFMRSLPQHATKFAAAGVNIFKPGSKSDLLPLENIFAQIKKSPLSLDRAALIKSFGRTEGERYYQLLKDMTEQYEKLKIAGEANGVVIRDGAVFAESSAGRINIAMESLKNSFADALTPERLDQLVGGIETIAGSLENLAGLAGLFSDAIGGVVNWTHNRAIDKTISDYNREDRGALHGIPGSGGENTLARQKGFAGSIRDIMGSEGKFGNPTQESVRRALRLSMGYHANTPEAAGRVEAARSYLIDRDSKIPEGMYKRIRDEVNQEMHPDVQKLVDKLAMILPDAIAKAVGAIPAPTVDGTPISNAAGNAPKHRRR